MYSKLEIFEILKNCKSVIELKKVASILENIKKDFTLNDLRVVKILLDSKLLILKL